MLSGVRADGERVKVRGLTDAEAKDMASRLFPSSLPSLGAKPTESESLDDFGLPPLRVSASVVGSVASNPAALPQTPTVQQEVKQVVDKAKKAKQAQSLMELVGMGWAAGTVMGGKKLCERVSDNPVKPSPKQVNDLAESAKDTLTDWFGDRDIKPWQMTILLTLAIPMSMLIQSPKRKEIPAAKQASSQPSEPLPQGAQNPPPAPLRSV